MEVNSHLILRLEKLSNLRLSDEERSRFAGEIGKIVDMVDQLQQLDTSGIEPLAYLSDREDALREDEINHQVPLETALANAPAQDGQFFRAPKVSTKPE